MLSTKARPITRHQYALIPPGAPNYQLIEGDLIMAPSPSSFHQEIIINLATMFRTYLRENPIGKVYIAPLDTYLSDINVYQPDLLFVRKENLDIVEEHGVEGAPDLAIEILSKASAKYDLGIKRSADFFSGSLEGRPPRRLLSATGPRGGGPSRAAVRKNQLGIKRSIYARTGVEELWIIDPGKRTVALYRLAENPETPAAKFKGKQRFSSDILPGLTINLVEVFAS